MSYTGNEGAEITLTEAAAMTAAYRTANPTGLKGHYFGEVLLKNICNQTGAVGIRFYHGIDTLGAPQLVAVGVDVNGDDITSGKIGDRSLPCPNLCSRANVLNS
jgi:hypothetical protein